MTKKKNKTKKINDQKSDDFLVLLSLCTLVIILVITIFNFSSEAKKTPQKTNEVNQEDVLARTDSAAQVFWNDFLESHPDYVPGWIELAKFAHQVRSYESAYNHYLKAKNISPNHQAVSEFEENYSSFLEEYL